MKNTMNTIPVASGKKSKIIFFVSGMVIAAVLLITGVIYHDEIRTVFKLLWKSDASNAYHVPGQSIVVIRSNIARLAMKSDLPEHAALDENKKVVDKVSILYPSFADLLSNPVKETGIESADDVYFFITEAAQDTYSGGFIFSLSDRNNFTAFLKKLNNNVDPNSGGSYSFLRISPTLVIMYLEKTGIVYFDSNQDKDALKEAEKILLIQKEDSFFRDTPKPSRIETGHDIDGWLAFGSIKNLNLPAALNENFGEFVDTSEITFNVSFEDGRIIANGSFFPNDTTAIGELLRKKGTVSESLLRSIPPKPIALLTTCLPFQSLKKMIPRGQANLDDRTNAAGVSGSDVIGSLRGDVVIALTNLDPSRKMLKGMVPEIELSAAVGLTGADGFKRVSDFLTTMSISKQTGAFYTISIEDFRAYYILKNDLFFISNNRDNIRMVCVGGYLNNDGLDKKLIESATASQSYLYVDAGRTASISQQYLSNEFYRQAAGYAGAAINSAEFRTTVGEDRGNVSMIVTIGKPEVNGFASLSGLILKIVSLVP